MSKSQFASHAFEITLQRIGIDGRAVGLKRKKKEKSKMRSISCANLNGRPEV